jgi:hypothetical protein
VKLRIRATPGGTVTQEGTLSLAPLAATGSVTVDIPKVGAFAPYLHDVLEVDAPSGRVHLAGRYRLEPARAGPRVVLSRVALDVRDLVLGPRGAKPTLLVPNLSVRDTTVDFAARAVSIGPVHSHGGWISVLRAANGKLRLASLLPRDEASEARPQQPGPPWSLVVALVDLRDWSGRYEDRRVSPPVDVSASSRSLRARDFKVAPQLCGHADLDLDVGEEGHVAVRGTAAIKPLALDFDASVTTAPISPFQGYFVKYEGSTIADGTVTAAGHLKLSFAPAPWKPKGREVKLDITGNAELDDVVARDGREGREVIRWRALRISGVALSLQPVRLTIRDVALVEPAARLELGPGRKSNFGPFGNPDAKAKERRLQRQAAAKAAGKPVRRPSITISHFTLHGGRLRFLDASIRPHFFTEVEDLDTEVTNLSSDRTARSEVRLRGRVEHTGELAVSGTLNPLADQLTLDMKLSLRNLDLPFANPYAARYVGYLVDKGKLDLTVESRVRRDHLDAQSRIFINKLELGPKVVSPRALKIPVELAVSALRDRGGRFELDVPVSGSFANPNFRLAPAIEGAFTKVLRRVVTLPFAILGRAVRGGGGGATLSIVSFAPGTSALDPAAARKTAELGQRLRGMREGWFAIEGAADPGRDVEAVRRFLREHGRTVDGAAEAAALEALARRRAESVRDALARAAPNNAVRLFVARPRVAAGVGGDVRVRVQRD